MKVTFKLTDKQFKIAKHIKTEVFQFNLEIIRSKQRGDMVSPHT